MQELRQYLTPPQLARIWGVKPDKIVAWIKRGELRAVDVSNHPGCGRPRFRIPPDAIREFEERRSGAAPSKPLKKRKPALPKDFVRYFS